MINLLIVYFSVFLLDPIVLFIFGMRVSIPYFFFRYGLNHQVHGSAHQGMGEPEDS